MRNAKGVSGKAVHGKLEGGVFACSIPFRGIGGHRRSPPLLLPQMTTTTLQNVFF
jgi:hypothetical protein